MKTETATIIFIILLTSMYNLAQNALIMAPPTTIKVPEDYPTIQEAVDAANPGDTILVANGIYHENIVIYKDNLTLFGENHKTTIIDSKGIGEAVYITASNTHIGGFTIRNGYCGIYLNYANNASLIGNIIANNLEYGIYMDHSANNILRENTITNNWQGILLWYSGGSTIYHNSFINNTQQVGSYESANVWDDGYPSGGNYWSDYDGVDKLNGPNQNQPGSDGIGDTPYTIETYNQDKYPLIKPYSPHDIGITELVISKTAIRKGMALQINVTVLNFGVYAETFNVTLYADKDKTIIGDEILIETQTVDSLQSRNSKILIFQWNTIDISAGTYWISAEANTVEGEHDPADNLYMNGPVTVFSQLEGGGGWRFFKLLY